MPNEQEVTDEQLHGALDPDHSNGRGHLAGNDYWPFEDKDKSKSDEPDDDKIDEKNALAKYSEQNLALEFIKKHRTKARYLGDLQQWFVWDSTRWHLDQKRLVFAWAQRICRAKATEALNNDATEKYARALLSAKTRYAVSSLASDNQKIAMLADEFDRDPMALGMPDSTKEDN
jgi:phage/plasmid-associated DNA primase